VFDAIDDFATGYRVEPGAPEGVFAQSANNLGCHAFILSDHFLDDDFEFRNTRILSVHYQESVTVE
jgi:hypothetical protein